MNAPVVPQNYRTIFISDVHMGTKRAQVGMLLDFLRSSSCEKIYLVGDIVDNWALRRSWYWDQSHNDLIQLLLKKAKRGTEIVYVPGNHDEQFRDFVDQRFGNVRIKQNDVHVTYDGKRYLVLHGDEFDGVVLYAKWLPLLGDKAYGWALSLNYYFNRLRRMFGLPYWSLSAYLKRQVKSAVAFVGHFEDAVVREAKTEKADGVICGQIHTAEMRMIDGVHYCNDGDWVESCTALVEHKDGRMELID